MPSISGNVRPMRSLLILITLALVGTSAGPRGWSQENVPAPLPNLDQEIADARQSLRSAAAVPPAPVAAGVAPARPGGFFHALSTTGKTICLKFKQSPLGELAGEMRRPLSTLTGGLVPSVKPPVAAEITAAGPQGTAAQIQAIKLDAPKRVESVAQLSNLDIRYHPEAAVTLIAALRADPSECVRLEAARSMTTLRTCTKPIAESLRICVEGTQSDGNPAELSPAVRQQAALALSRCLSCLCDSGPSINEEPRPEYPTTPAGFTAQPSRTDADVRQANLRVDDYYRRIEQVSAVDVSRAAQQTLTRFPPPTENVTQVEQNRPRGGEIGLLEIWRASRQ
jgi:hypothetical protein